NDDRDAAFIGAGPDVALDLQLAHLPVIGRNDHGVVVTHLGGNFGVVERFQSGDPSGGGEGDTAVLAGLLQRHAHNLDALVSVQMWELTDAGRRGDTAGALLETPIDLLAQGVVVDAVVLVHGCDD